MNLKSKTTIFAMILTLGLAAAPAMAAGLALPILGLLRTLPGGHRGGGPRLGAGNAIAGNIIAGNT